MRSKPILLSVAFSIIMLMAFAVNINVYRQPFRVTYDDLTKDVQRQVTCLADNIYFEAAHEPLDGKKAVAFVTFNRVRSGNYPSNICDVVYQKTGGVCQFSWYCEGKTLQKRLTIRDTSLYNQIRQLAVDMIVNHDRLEDVTKGSTYYHADYVNPGWKLERVQKIGRHIFYRSVKDKIDMNKEII